MLTCSSAISFCSSSIATNVPICLRRIGQASPGSQPRAPTQRPAPESAVAATWRTEASIASQGAKIYQCWSQKHQDSIRCGA